MISQHLDRIGPLS